MCLLVVVLFGMSFLGVEQTLYGQTLIRLDALITPYMIRRYAMQIRMILISHNAWFPLSPTTGFRWSSLVLCSKLRFDGWPAMPHVSRKLSIIILKNFRCFKFLEGWLVSVTNQKFHTHENFPIYSSHSGLYQINFTLTSHKYILITRTRTCVRVCT